MFKKICFMVCAISMAFSAESFAKKHSSQENLERRSLAKARAKAQKRLQKEQAVARRPAKQFAKGKKVEEKPLRKNRKARAVPKRKASSVPNPQGITQITHISKKRGRTKQVAQVTNSSEVNVNGHIIKGGKSVIVTNGKKGTFNVDVDGVRTVIPNKGKGLNVINNSSGGLLVGGDSFSWGTNDWGWGNTGDWIGSWAEFDKAMAKMDED